MSKLLTFSRVMRQSHVIIAGDSRKMNAMIRTLRCGGFYHRAFLVCLVLVVSGLDTLSVCVVVHCQTSSTTPFAP
jgi:hypothetical protein